MTTKTATRPSTAARQYPAVDPDSLPSLTPLADAMHQNPFFFDAVTTLDKRFGGPSTLVDGNTIVCWNPRNLLDRVMPDCYVAFDVDAAKIREQNGYLIWVVGKPPDFVLEIASRSTWRNDLTRKRRLYEDMKVPEIWWSDPTGGRWYGSVLSGQRLVDGRYVDIPLAPNADGLLSGWSETLGLFLCVAPNGRIIFYDPIRDEYLLNYKEELEARLVAEEAQLAAEEARLAAEDARLTAEDELSEERAARLAAEAALSEERAARLAAEDALSRARDRQRPSET